MGILCKKWSNHDKYEVIMQIIWPSFYWSFRLLPNDNYHHHHHDSNIWPSLAVWRVSAQSFLPHPTRPPDVVISTFCCCCCFEHHHFLLFLLFWASSTCSAMGFSLIFNITLFDNGDAIFLLCAIHWLTVLLLGALSLSTLTTLPLISINEEIETYPSRCLDQTENDTYYWIFYRTSFWSHLHNQSRIGDKIDLDVDILNESTEARSVIIINVPENNIWSSW